MSKKIVASCLALIAFVAAFAADVTVPSRYDEATDTWIGDVDFLTNAFKNVTASQKIYLSKGIYDLSPLTNAPLYAPSGSGYGSALLGFPWVKNIKVIGATGNPRDVVLMAKDSNYRVLALASPNSELYNVTVTEVNTCVYGGKNKSR